MINSVPKLPAQTLTITTRSTKTYINTDAKCATAERQVLHLAGRLESQRRSCNNVFTDVLAFGPVCAGAWDCIDVNESGIEIQIDVIDSCIRTRDQVVDIAEVRRAICDSCGLTLTASLNCATQDFRVPRRVSEREEHLVKVGFPQTRLVSRSVPPCHHLLREQRI